MALLITNNDKAKKFCMDCRKEVEVIYLADGTYLDVLLRTRDYVHRGYRLLTHPLCGSVKPNQTPYRSVLLEKQSAREENFRSVELIENSIDAARKFMRNRGTPRWNERTREDFKTVDLSFLTVYEQRNYV
ncbi:GrdX family protein [Bacilliculturomica massiliensis]|uniref:GrdX family protein n=1 Tax=Bacilliculturomica massiliensis TaxID=1917867 RepID=UPI0010308B46|nr:GrdX family protein [Bacilliculturomica massiliensis]